MTVNCLKAVEDPLTLALVFLTTDRSKAVVLVSLLNSMSLIGGGWLPPLAWYIRLNA